VSDYLPKPLSKLRMQIQCIHLWMILLAFAFVVPSFGSAQKFDFAAEQAKVEKLLVQNRNDEAMRIAQIAATTEIEDCRRIEDERVANARLWLGETALQLKQFLVAESEIQKALSHRQKYIGKASLPTAEAHAALARVFLETGLGDRAESELESALRIYAALGNAKLQESQAREQLAGLCLMSGRLSDAEKLYDSVLTFEALRLGDHNPELARVLNNLGGTYLAQGRYERAKGTYEQAMNLQTAAFGADGLPLATTCTNLGVLSEQLTDYPEAEKYLLRAYAIRNQHLRLWDPLVLVSLDNLVSFHIKQNEFSKAEALLVEAKRLREQRLGADQPAVAEILDRFATLSMARDQADHAERYWLLALQIRENSLGPQHEFVAANLYNLGKLENVLHKNDQARIHLNWALDIYEGQSVGNEGQVTAVLSELFMCDFMQGKIEDAAAQLELMRTIKAEVFGDAHPETIAVMEEQLKFYTEVQWLPQAAQIEAEILKIRGR
jgi:tetratricopeptide (TPR) repeat protein